MSWASRRPTCPAVGPLHAAAGSEANRPRARSSRRVHPPARAQRRKARRAPVGRPCVAASVGKWLPARGDPSLSRRIGRQWSADRSRRAVNSWRPRLLRRSTTRSPAKLVPQRAFGRHALAHPLRCRPRKLRPWRHPRNPSASIPSRWPFHLRRPISKGSRGAVCRGNRAGPLANFPTTPREIAGLPDRVRIPGKDPCRQCRAWTDRRREGPSLRLGRVPTLRLRSPCRYRSNFPAPRPGPKPLPAQDWRCR